ncbi:NUDIX hydrolase [Micromonosporaceae bacterium Da 78-11]
MADPVRAAGGVLYRPAGDGLEICLVHRPRYDDWSLPKGHLDGGEHPLAAAVREVLEETGVAGTPQLRLPPVAYDLPDGTAKTVDFWLMRADERDGPVQDTAEVDSIAWVPLAEAAGRLSYPDDRALVEHVAGLPPITAVAGLVRHAHAGERKKWTGNDALRPVDAQGRQQAERIGAVLALLRPARLFAATPLRCKQTLEPLAAATGLPIVVDGAFAEPPEAQDAPAKAKSAVPRLLDLRAGGVPVICSQGKVMPWLLAALAEVDDPEPYKTPKGDGWLLTWSGETVLGLSRL